MSRTSKRMGTKTKVIPGSGGQKPPKFKYSRRTKYHPNKPSKKGAKQTR